MYKQVFSRCFRGPIRVPRIENRVPWIRENYHRVPRIRENRVPRIREIGSLQVDNGYLTFSLKKWYKPKKYFSANQQKCLKEPILLQLLVEYSQSTTASKHNRSNAFRSFFGAPACCIPPNGDESFISRPSKIPL